MGGDYYDRNYIPSSLPVFSKDSNKDLDPKTHIAQGGITSPSLNPIVIAFDVTGSMGDWTKIFYQKLPVFYGQLMINSYVIQPALSICAIGDIESDKTPLQVSKYLQGKQIDYVISKLFLQGGGGANQRQSYDLAAYFYNNYSSQISSQLPFFFFTGDQGYYQHPRSIKYNKFLGVKPVGETVDTKQQWNQLLQNFNVFHLKKQFEEPDVEQKIYHQWVNTLGKDRVIKVIDPRASIDIMLGLISITSGSRNLESYLKDMQGRGQSEQRISQVGNALKDYAHKIQTKQIMPVVFKTAIQKFKQSYANQLNSGDKNQREGVRKLKQIFKGQLPESFYCPITGDIFMQPVMTCDGQTYQKTAIESWLSGHDTSPLTGKILPQKTLTQNFLIKKMINQMMQNIK